MIDLPRLEAEVLNYVIAVDELYGHYLDTTAGFIANARQVEEVQKSSRPNLPPGTDPDALDMFYGHGDPNDPANRILHRTTQGEYKRRNAKGGHNHLRAAQLLMVLIFEYWESEHRAKIAEAHGFSDPDYLKIPIIGDLRLLRQDILHHRSIIRPETFRKLAVIQGLVADTELALNDQDVESLVSKLKGALDDIVIKAGGTDPEHRKIWHVQ